VASDTYFAIATGSPNCVMVMIQPGLGITGAAIGIMVGLVTVTLLHFFTMLKLVPIKVPFSQYGFVTLLMAAMYVLEKNIFPTLLPSYLSHPLVTMLFLIIAYLFIGRTLNVIKREDWAFLSKWRRSS